jgi:TrmH family RNA methyltransferase
VPGIIREQTGLTDFWMDQADLKVNIPMLGKIDSLNVASAATILLYEAARQRSFRKRPVSSVKEG